MQTIGPFAPRDVLGQGPAGRVLRAVDQQGRRVAMAVLEGPAANDPQRRWQFTSTVEQLRRAQDSTVVAADLVGAQPWAAFADDGGGAAAGVFAAIGAPCTPVAAQAPHPPSQAVDPSVPPQQQSAFDQSAANRGAQQPVQHAPQNSAPVNQAVPGPGPTTPPENPPAPDAPAPDPFAPVDPFSSVDAPEPFAPVRDPGPYPNRPDNSPPLRFSDPEQKPRGNRKGLLILVAGLVLVLLGGGVGGAVYFSSTSGQPEAHESASPAPSSGRGSPATDDGSSPTPHTQQSAPSKPDHPGKEPPKDGSWPARFASFGGKDTTRTLKDLAGLDFTLVVPDDWTCTKKDQSTSYVNYHCAGVDPKAGGDLIVRTCSEPCDAAKKIRMRGAEEAWGLQWVRDGGNCSWADSRKVDGPDGKTRYGIVMVRYWHSTPGGPMDRQVVLRMTAPKSDAAEIQKVANAVRDATQ